MNFLGLDIGTSRCKAVVFDNTGKQLAMSHREYKVISLQEGWAELDSNEVVDKCFQVIKECASLVEVNSIYGMGISSQGEAFTALDENGEILANAMVSSDTRSKPYLNTLKKCDFDFDKLYGITGHTPHPMFTLFKLMWLKKSRPELWKKAHKILCFEDLFIHKLGLEPTISYSLAGRTMMFDVNTHQWSSEILNFLELDASKLATPKPSGTIVGKLEPSIIEKLGFRNDAFVVTGGHDQVCGAVGSGITKSGTAMYATGTVECITPVLAQPIFSDDLCKNNLCTYDYAMQNMYCTVAFSLTGGNILRWFRDELGEYEIEKAQVTGEDVYKLLLDNVDNKPSGLLALPYFTPSGTPYFDTETKGAIIGLRLNTNKGEIIRALLEGVTYEMRLNIDILEKSGFVIDELRAVGGGSKSKKWIQLKADILGKKIVILKVNEAGCLGAAMLAYSAISDKSLNQISTEWVNPVDTVYPQSENKKEYDKYFNSYTKLYALAKEIDI